MQLGDLPTAFILFPHGWETFRQILSNFCVVGRPSINFHHLYLHPGDLALISVNFPCSNETFHHIRQLLVLAEDLPSNFHVDGRPSVHSRQLSIQPGDLSSTSVHFL